MSDDPFSGIRIKFTTRADAISRNWCNSIIPPGTDKDRREEIEEQIHELTEQAIGIILRKQFDQKSSISMGQSLAKIAGNNTEIIGRTLEVLTYEYTRDLTPEELSIVHPTLSSFTASVSLGFMNGIKGSLLEEQERIKNILLKDLLSADARLREINEKLEARVEQRTFELKRLNEELKEHVHEREVAERKLRERENLLSVVFDSSVVWIGLLDREGRMILPNRGSLDFLGIQPSDVIGRYFWETPWWSHSERLRTEVEKAIREAGKGRSTTLEVHHIDREGNMIEVELSIRPVRNEEGEVAFIIPEGVNVTGRKEKERDLERSRSQLIDLIENTKDIMFSFDNRGIITFIGPQVENFGYRREELIGKSIEGIMEVLDTDDRQKASEMFKRRLADGDDTSTVYRIMDRGGGLHWIEENVVIKTDPDGNLLAVNGVIRDITDRKLVEEELVKVNEVLRLVNRIMRHDIKNRLSVAYGILGILAEKDNIESDLIGEALNSVEGTIEIAKRMEELESLIKLRDAGEKRSLSEIITEVSGNAGVKISVEGDCPVVVDGAFISVIENLVSNSVKHGGAKEVRFRIRKKKNRCELEVIDDGEGVPDSIRDLLFEESFSWGPNKGTGLGLFIAKKVIESYGGSIRVGESKTGGARFIVVLPAGEQEDDR